jgi:hypothetical protein
MTPVYAHPSPPAIVAPFDSSRSTPNPSGEVVDEGPAGSLFGRTVIEELKWAPYRGLEPVLTASAPIDYKGAEAALREYLRSQGENFDALAAKAGEHFKSARLVPNGEPLPDDIIEQLVEDDEEWLSDDLS